jgi:hypothetical protein
MSSRIDMKRSRESGVTTLMVIAFMGIFLIIMGSITSFALEEARYGRALLGREQAFDAAEAGLEYYRSFLAYNPGNLTNGTGKPGPYTYAVNDPETGAASGNASISVVGNTQCGQIQSIDITSTGTSAANPGFPRTLFARYMQASVAAYSGIIGISTEVGSYQNITGTYFSDGGIRMDGTNNSYVQSALSTWNCTTSYGCNPVQPTAPGVVGNGSGSALWQYPVTPINFATMGTNLANLKTYAQSGGLYFPPASGSATQRGYHLIFNGNGTVTVTQVTSTIGIPSDSTTHGWSLVGPGYPSYPPEYSIINTEQPYGQGAYTIPSTCALIFVEDRAWIEGTVKGKATVVVATPSAPNSPPDAYLPNNITYAANDGTNGLTVISQGGVLITLQVPNTMILQGTFVALGGAVERPQYTANYYGCPNFDVNCVNPSYAQYATRSQLTIEGSLISNLRPYFQEGSVSGFANYVGTYDQLQATNPPPFTPAASANYQFVLWKEL